MRIQETRDTYYRLLAQPRLPHRRYLFDTFDATRRLAGLLGPRGVGKTTLMLQWIREKGNPERCMYASLDHIYFSAHRLLDFVRDMHQLEGRTLFFLDEAHKYPEWNREIKNIYDSFPEVRIVFSGSSSLDLVKGQYDLSRCGMIYRLNGLSFREFILFQTGKTLTSFSLDDLLERRVEISKELSNIPRILGLFQEFLRVGYYPFYFEDPRTYYSRILNTIDKTIFEDIANFFSLSTTKLPVFKRLLAYLASIPPGEISVNALARILEIDHKTVSGYLHMMQDTSLTHSLSLAKGGKAGLRSADKVLLENANLYFAVAKETGLEPNLGSLRETFFVNALRGSGVTVNYSKEGDYRASGRVFEIGGEGKTKKQIRGLKSTFLVKDGVMTAGAGEVPLHLFGFLW
ncbi:MAG: AAA family ATPase [Fibrobacterota bacterium]|nr:AAA family ATPase [Fibrobacterota bacterium]